MNSKMSAKPITKVVRTVAVTLLCVGSLFAGSATAAATPTPAPTSTALHYVDYSGLGHARISCDSGGCFLTALISAPEISAIDLIDGKRIRLIHGKASVEMPVQGNPRALCENDQGPVVYIGAGRLTVTATATKFVAMRVYADSPLVICPDGSAAVQRASSLPVEAAFVGGSPCVLNGSCPKQVATAPGVATPGAATPGFATPGALSALPTLREAATVHGIVWAAALAIVLVLLVAFPTHLLNDASEVGLKRLREWWAKRRRSAEPKPDGPEVGYRGWPIAVLGVVAASLISSFVDPEFGLNAASVRIFLSVFSSFVVDVAGGWFLLIFVVRRARPHTTARFRFAPISLVVVGGAVVFTRLTGFSPGIIFGLVAGVAFGTVLATAERARVALIGIGYSFVVAILGWTGYSLLASTVGTHPSGGILFVQETLSAVTIGGIAALPIALVPLRGLTGYDIFRWSRWVWGAAYATGLFGFFVVLMPLPFAWSEVHLNLIVWIAVYLAYAVAAFAAWLVVTKPWVRPDGSAAADADVDGGTKSSSLV